MFLERVNTVTLRAECQRQSEGRVRAICQESHTYIDTYIHTYIHTHIHTYIHMYTHTYTHTYATGNTQHPLYCPGQNRTESDIKLS